MAEVKVPVLGESITEATLGEWLKQPGDPVQADEPIASLETDKVSVEVPSPVAGVMGEQKVAVGDTVEVGALIATVEQGGAAKAAPAPAPAASPEPQPKVEEAAAPAAAGQQAPAGNVDAAALSPSVRRAVLEYGVDPATITGTGKDGRITKDDVIAASKAAPAAKPASDASAAPAAAPAAGGERKEERVRMTRLRQTIAKRLKEAQNTAAMLTTFNDVDMTAVIEA
ncbi:MAG: biotin/lipoyl-containing protein, partial [Sphingomonas sp.]